MEYRGVINEKRGKGNEEGPAKAENSSVISFISSSTDKSNSSNNRNSNANSINRKYSPSSVKLSSLSFCSSLSSSAPSQL